ncbi:TonB-dependent receptor [Alkalitalea saponilacus]|uniref:TonB-dependent Receptor Plug Domain n=1 Tax=Alkalitalea saponilacus TaxID=889453 RepID=A0A1T5HT52_9BACT|nr:carboxypeptidase-like regulatory domain-containing protein [Alkalitalea saponilacus]ASB48529.1 hypothetical protein CDL62_04940 [Alkalitalea saponilacus]SKC23847.1 TonB-dependent Receptor Plug Domain [Alkalitalea saponilacus]
MYIRLFSLIFLVFCIDGASVAAQSPRQVVSGTVLDVVTGEVLIGAYVFCSNGKYFATSNAQGHFTLWLNSRDFDNEITVTHIGYAPAILHVESFGQRQTVYLTPAHFSLDEVVVSSQKVRDFMMPEVSVFQLERRELQLLPSFAGEKDLLLYLQKTPGVSTAGDGNANMYVRGGGHEQNLFLLDYMPLYHVSHFGGFTSTFNSDIINSADVYLGGFPARYGGRLSSVVDVYSRDGNNLNHKKQLTLGMLTSKAMLEGPIVREKSSYLVAFRKNTFPFFRWVWGMDENYTMYDVNVKLNHRFTEKDRLYFSYYIGNDQVSVRVKNDDRVKSRLNVGWGNHAFSLRYNKVFDHFLYINVIVGKSGYDYREKSAVKLNNEGSSGNFRSVFMSGIEDEFVKIHLDYQPLNNMAVFFGSELFRHSFKPGNTHILQSGSGFADLNEKGGFSNENSFSPSFFGEMILKDIYGFSLNGGVRVSSIYTKSENYTFVKPRITVARRLSYDFSVKFSYSEMMQHFHLISNNSAGMPTDFRIPVFDLAPPSISQQFLAGIYHSSYDDMYEVSLETYYKKMNDLADLKEGVSFTTAGFNWESILAVNGQGESRGVEFLVRKTKGESTGWMGTSLSRSERRFDDLNSGKKFPFKYDRLFSISCFYQQQISEKVSMSFAWDLGTGLPYSLPKSQYRNHEGDFVFIYDGINGYRDIWYHRGDVGLSYVTVKNKFSSEWSLSVINVYNRRNPNFYFTRIHDESPTLYRFSLFPIMPSASYTIKF